MSTWRRTAAAAGLLSVGVTLAGCGADRADQAVIDRLRTEAILDAPAGATPLASRTHKGGGSDLAGARGASSVTVTWATTRRPDEVAAFFHSTFDSTWDLHDNGYAPGGGWSAIGADRKSPGTVATIEARAPRSEDGAPVEARSVVTVQLSATRE
jgi:hypothetical protein